MTRAIAGSLSNRMAMGIYRHFGKRVVDFGIALLALIVLSPVFLVVVGVVLVFLGRPVFFSQRRPGLRGRPFDLLKFRTMSVAKEGSGVTMPDSQRITRVGQVLRLWSLDELPELLNVLKGDMSIVGPRPLLMDYLELYSEGQARRHEVRPGITGWAQIHGRNAISWEKKFKLDVWYVDHMGFALDVQILWRTIGSVLRREGIAAEGHATMPPFRSASPIRATANRRLNSPS